MSSESEIVELVLPDGGIIFAEVELPAGGDAAFGGRRLSLDELRENISNISTWVTDSIRHALPEAPDKIAVEFGIKLTAKTGPLVAALAEASGESSIVVKLEWSRQRVGGEQP